MLSDGLLVRCLDTGQVGVVVKKIQASWATMVLVRWGDEEVWTDAVDLEVIDAEHGDTSWTSF